MAYLVRWWEGLFPTLFERSDSKVSVSDMPTVQAKSGAGRNYTACSDLQPTELSDELSAALGTSATVEVGWTNVARMVAPVARGHMLHARYIDSPPGTA